jgi:hypothetical protein
MLEMAKRLDKPENGDTQFECTDDDGNPKKLYAMSVILETSVPYLEGMSRFSVAHH